MKLLSPKNTEIIGTLERLYGVATIVNEATQPDPDKPGCFDIDYDGQTDIDWSGADGTTVKRDGERIFLDAQGNEFKESELRLV